MYVMIVSNTPSRSQAVELMLERENVSFEVIEADDAVSVARNYPDFDIVLVDLDEPAAMISELRRAGVHTPCLALVDGAEDHKVRVQSLAAGADDALNRPFHNDELMARVRAVVRRSKGVSTSTVAIGNLVIDTDSQTVAVAGSMVHVTNKEYALLELLAMRKGITVSKETILSHLYGGHDEPAMKIIDVFTCKLRRKLATVVDDSFVIETVWGRGYLIRENMAKPLAQAA